MPQILETFDADNLPSSYALAESLNATLDETTRNLQSMITEVNDLTGPRNGTGASSRGVDPSAVQSATSGGSKEDPVSQIVAILNAHLGSLKWIDETSSALKDKLESLRRGQTPQPAARAAASGSREFYGRASSVVGGGQSRRQGSSLLP